MAAYEKLASCDIFSTLSQELLKNLEAYSKGRSFRAGQVLFRENEPATYLYAVTQGQVQLQMAVPKRDLLKSDVTLTTAGSGRVIGFWALIPPFVYPFTAVALTGGFSFVVDGQELRSQMLSNQGFGCDIMRQTAIVLARTLKETREVLGYERASRAD